MLHFWLGPGMNRPLEVATRPKLALQSYLDALLYDATEVLEEPSSSLDDFQAAVLEEQAFDARMQAQIKPLALAVAAPAPVAVAVKVAAPVAVVEVAPVIIAEAVQVVAATPTVELVEPVAEL
ncbi:CheW-like protein, partial [Pseudomonas syringae pv. actinidiae ICMP 19096]